jgi:hypothetical protein
MQSYRLLYSTLTWTQVGRPGHPHSTGRRDWALSLIHGAQALGSTLPSPPVCRASRASVMMMVANRPVSRYNSKIARSTRFICNALVHPEHISEPFQIGEINAVTLVLARNQLFCRCHPRPPYPNTTSRSGDPNSVSWICFLSFFPSCQKWACSRPA